jgi:hypothetical protein
MNSEKEKRFNNLVEGVKKKVSYMEALGGGKPTFESYIYQMLEEDIISFYSLEKNMKAHALLWEKAGLGMVDWKKIYNKINDEMEGTHKFLINLESNNEKKKEAVMKEEKSNGNEENSSPKNESKFNVIDKYINSAFRIIDKEFIRLFKELGSFSILIIIISAILAKHIIIDIVGAFSYRDIESEMYTLYMVISIFILIYLFFLKDTEKNNALNFIKYFISIKLMLFLIIGGPIYGIWSFFIK